MFPTTVGSPKLVAVLLLAHTASAQFATSTTAVSASRTSTVATTPAPTVDAWFLNSLKNGLNNILGSVFPALEGIGTLTLPTTFVIDGSTYKLPAIALQTSTSSASSFSSVLASLTPTSTSVRPTSTPNSPSPSSLSRSSTQQPQTIATSTSTSTSSAAALVTSATTRSASVTPTSGTTIPSTTTDPVTTSDLSNASVTQAPVAAPMTASDKRLGIILGVILGLLAVGILLAVLCIGARRRRRTGGWLKHEKPLLGAEEDGSRGPLPTFPPPVAGAGYPAKAWTAADAQDAAETGAVGAVSAPAQEHKRRGSRIPLLAGILAARKRKHGERLDDGHHQGNTTPPQYEAVQAVAADGPYSRAADAESKPLRHSYHSTSDHEGISPVPNPYELTPERPNSGFFGYYSQGNPLAPVTEESCASSIASSMNAAAARRASTPHWHPGFEGSELPRDNPGRPRSGAYSVVDEAGYGSNRSTIARKPVPGSVTQNPFASPADPPSGDLGYGRYAPNLPQRDPRRMSSGEMHYAAMH